MTQKPVPDIEPLVARDATYYRAPDALRRRVRESLAAESHPSSWPFVRRWGAMAAMMAIVAVVSWNAALYSGGREQDRMVREVAGAHVRSLMAEGHLNDVASSDQHTVKPWFQGKVDFAPTVADFTADGFALVGGRLDYLDGRPVAAITYRYRLHVVNLFEWSSGGARDLAPELNTRDGYSVVHWRRAGLEYWLVSDAASGEMLRLARLLAG